MWCIPPTYRQTLAQGLYVTWRNGKICWRVIVRSESPKSRLRIKTRETLMQCSMDLSLKPEVIWTSVNEPGRISTLYDIQAQCSQRMFPFIQPAFSTSTSPIPETRPTPEAEPFRLLCRFDIWTIFSRIVMWPKKSCPTGNTGLAILLMFLGELSDVD